MDDRVVTDGSVSKEVVNATSSSSSREGQIKSSCILVSPRQKGNPILKCVRCVPWQFDNIVPDYQLGPTTCALYLSLRYHNLNPTYIHDRLKLLANSYDLRILLVLVDVKDPHHALKELGKICILADCTLILSFSFEEAGRYLELYKSYESKSADMIMEKNDDNYMNKLAESLTSVKRINRTDVATLSSTFGSFKDIANAPEDSLALCPGIGPSKAQSLYKVLHQPFKKTLSKK